MVCTPQFLEKLKRKYREIKHPPQMSMQAGQRCAGDSGDDLEAGNLVHFGFRTGFPGLCLLVCSSSQRRRKGRRVEACWVMPADRLSPMSGDTAANGDVLSLPVCRMEMVPAHHHHPPPSCAGRCHTRGGRGLPGEVQPCSAYQRIQSRSDATPYSA